MKSWRIVPVDHNSVQKEKEEVSRFSEGNYLEMTRSRLEKPWDGERYGFVAAFDGDRCIGTTSYTISCRGQGILSQVHTDPDYRRQGVCNAAVDGTLAVFRTYGARAVYLAAWSDWIRNIYRKMGFELVGTMGERHAFKLTLNESGKDDNLFRSGQKSEIRPMGKGDQCDLTALFNTRHPLVVKHYDLGCFLGSHFEGEFYILQNQTIAGIAPEERKEKRGFRALVLDGEETILGFGTVIPSSRRHEGHTGILDFLVQQNYFNRVGELLERLEENCELDNLTVYVEKNEEEKRGLLEKAGYKSLTYLERQIDIFGESFDLVLYRKMMR
ncbi:MAG: GNAT family N-acetyltransferase [Candidatus Latescibacterota bacterium]